MQAKLLWSLWQDLALRVAAGFTAPGRRRFVEWVTGLALNDEEHTLTQSLLSLDRAQDWKALEAFAEAGAWDQRFLAWETTWLLDTLPQRRWFGFYVSAVDDTKVHRSSPDVWGTCTFHEYTARSPNRAQTVRAHNWVVLGALVPREAEPAWFLPINGRLYFRKTQLPQAGLPFRTKNDLLVELAREQAAARPGPHVVAFDGAFAVANVVRPLVCPAVGQPRIDFVTRLRPDSRLCALPVAPAPAGRPGPRRKWGRPLPPPRQGGRWPGGWHEARAFLYGRWRQVRWKEVVCQWRVLGHQQPVKAVVAQVEGYRRRFTLVSSATALTGLQIVTLFCARFRQEDGFRDLKQRLGWEEGRAWTRTPIERTAQALFVTLTLLRLLQARLAEREEDGWWERPPWNPHRARPSVLDAQRLLRQHRQGIQQCLSDWLAEGEKQAG